MAKVRYTRASDDQIMKSIAKQARGKKVPVKCPECGAPNKIDAADIFVGGQEVQCSGCSVVFKLTGKKG